MSRDIEARRFAEAYVTLISDSDINLATASEIIDRIRSVESSVANGDTDWVERELDAEIEWAADARDLRDHFEEAKRLKKWLRDFKGGNEMLDQMLRDINRVSPFLWEVITNGSEYKIYCEGDTYVDDKEGALIDLTLNECIKYLRKIYLGVKR